MKKLLTYSLLLAAGLCIYSCATYQTDSLYHAPKVYDKQTRADLAAIHNFEMIKDPKTNTVPREEMWKAIEELKKQERYKEKAAISNITWTERGPNNVGGRTRTIMFDPNDGDKNRVFAGSVAGGLWVTDDIYAATPTWTPVDEFLDNLAITSLAYDPSSPDTMYFGTGEGFFNADAVQGDGIWRSVDGGVNWTQLSSTTSYSFIQKIVVDSVGNIYAATRNYGIVKSTNAGASFTAVLNTSGSSSTNRAADLEIARNGDIYAAMGLFATDGVYKSSNGGTSWTKVYTASGENRIEIACAPTNSDVVYMVTQSSTNYNANAVRRSDNAGSSWTSISNPNDDVAGQNFLRGQGWYNISLAVDPNDAATVYMGGIDLYKTTNSGSTWSEVSHWYGGGGHPYVHADQHCAVYAPGSSDSIIFGNDGGLFLSENATSSTPSFAHQVNSYNVTQFYGGAIHPTAGSNYVLAGAQDNGSHKFTAAGMNSTTEVSGGDGAFCHIDQNDPTYQFTQYVYNSFYRSTNSGTSFSSITFSSSAGKFINPTDYDNDAFIMYSSWQNGGFLRWSNPRTGTTAAVVGFGTTGTGEPSAITCDPNTSNRIYIGTDNGQIWKIDNAHSTISNTNITGSGMSGYVSSIDVELGDANHLLATFSNYSVISVWESTDGGSSWSNVEGNLPNIPVRWGMFSPMGGDSALLATELGVWSTDNLNGTSTNWAATNTGLANVRTDMLQWRSSDSTVIAITHGRGLYSYSFSQIINADFISDKDAVYPCETVNFTDASTGATSWKWDFNDDGIVDATTQNPSWTYKEGGYKTVKLVINNSDSTTKTDFITVIPKLGTPYTVSDGGNFETNTFHFASQASTGTNLWERGAPSNALSTLNSNSNGWKTDLDADCPDETIVCYLYTPSFNMTASGTYTMSFRKSMEMMWSNAPYCVIVEYSTNGGSSWAKLGTSPDANGSNWYANTSLHTLLQSDAIGFLENASNENTSYVISSLAGNSDVRFRFVFISNSGFSSAGFLDGFMLDDFAISGPTNEPYMEVETALNASATEYLGPNDTVNFISDNCKMIATIINLSSHDYGPTTVTIDNAGTGTMDFSTNTQSFQEIMEKTILITPTTNNTSGSVKIKTYYTGTEASNWVSTTGWNYADLNHIKSTGAITSGTIANTTHGASPLIDSAYLGSNVTITSTYSNGFSGVGAGKNGASGPLPVDLLSFTGERFESHTDLHWITATEINSDYFEIQRKSGDDYIAIARVKSAGNSNTVLNYKYSDIDADAQMEEVLYYRLKIVDLNGEYKFSKVIRLEKIAPNIVVNLSPNPVKNTLQINLNKMSDGQLDLHLYTLEGKEILNAKAIKNNQKFDVSDLPTGVYFVACTRENQIVYKEKIIISH